MVFLLFPGCHGYQVGAPDGVCISQHASHEGNTYQTSECPYKLTFSAANYTLSGEINSEFLGLLFWLIFMKMYLTQPECNLYSMALLFTVLAEQMEVWMLMCDNKHIKMVVLSIRINCIQEWNIHTFNILEYWYCLILM